MKTKVIWYTAAFMVVISVLLGSQWFWQRPPLSGFGIANNAAVFVVKDIPNLGIHWGDESVFKDARLHPAPFNLKNLNEYNAEESLRFEGFSYTFVQPGLFLLQLGDSRVYLMTEPFVAEALNPRVQLDFNSDWLILQKASLLPSDWPKPRFGWALLNGSVTKELQSFSTESGKPIVTPSNRGTVWVQRKDLEPWKIVTPN